MAAIALRGPLEPRGSERLTRRNGYPDRRWDTRVGSVDLAIPRVRDGSYFPSLLEPRRRAEQALLTLDGLPKLTGARESRTRTNSQEEW